MTTARLGTAHIVSRVLAGVAGGYLFAWGLVCFVTALAFAAGLAFGESAALASMLALVIYLVVFCWSFAAASLVRVWAVLAGGGAAMTLAGWAMSRTLT